MIFECRHEHGLGEIIEIEGARKCKGISTDGKEIDFVCRTCKHCTGYTGKRRIMCVKTSR